MASLVKPTSVVRPANEIGVVVLSTGKAFAVQAAFFTGEEAV